MQRIDSSVSGAARHLPGAVLLVAAVAAPWLVPGNWTNILIITLLFVFLCVAWNIVGGFAGQFCIGHSLFLAAGAYTSTLLYTHLGISPWIGMLAGGVVAATIGAFIAWLSFRYSLPHLSFALVTIALAMLGFLAISSIDFLGASRGLTLPVRGSAWDYHFRSDISYYYVILAQVVGAILLTQWLYGSKIGLYFRTIRDNERAALAIGVPPLRYKILAMAISAFLTAFAGVFYAQFLLYVEPKTFAGLTIVIEVILFTVVGGTGTIWGPVIGPLLLVPLGEVLRARLGGEAPGLHLLIYGILLVTVIRFWPGGLMAALRSLASPRRASSSVKEA